MKTALRVLFGIGAFLMIFRFGGPALLFGTTGAGPFGDPWVLPGQETTNLLDADLRFFGALLIGLGVMLVLFMRQVEKNALVIQVICYSVLAGALARLYSLFHIGHPGTTGVVPIAIELSLPIAILLVHRRVRAQSE